MNKINSKKPKILDLFAGVGGFSAGFLKSDFDIVAAIEFDKSIAESFAKNHKNTKVYNKSIVDIKPTEIYKDIGSIDIIIGGPPCQGFSLKGARGGLNDDRNFLFKEFIKYVEYFKPKYFVMENVPNILSEKCGFFKDEILKSFKDIGYNVNYGILNAAKFGVPQNRKRAIFIGKLNGEISLPTGNLETPTVWDAISDLAYLDSAEGIFQDKYKNKEQSEYQKARRDGNKFLHNHQATKHKEIAIDRLKRIPPEKGKEYLSEKISSTFGQTWGRLEKNKPSPTIITRFDTPSNGKNSHPYLHRAITPREAARIQSFDDDFIFYGNKTSVIKQIGNAVPPLLAYGIAQHIKQDYEK
jgi:DNA (cytosine-5)-methyltransferase 1